MSARFPFSRAFLALLACGLVTAGAFPERSGRAAQGASTAHDASPGQHASPAHDGDAPPSPAPADSLDASRIPVCPVPLDTVHVRATRLTRAQLLARKSSFSTVIEVAPTRQAGEELGDLLAHATGLRVSRLGGPGTPATVSIRGSAAGEVEVFLGRVPLRSASQGSVDLNAIDLGQVAAIEIYRSAPPNDLGGQVSAAAVRLVVRQDAGPGASLRAMSGSLGTREMTETLSLQRGRFDLFASLNRFATEGDFSYHSDNGTPYEPGDDARLAWRNGDLTRQTLFARGRLHFADEAFVEASSQIARRDQGVPGTRQTPTERVRFATESALHCFELSPGARWGPLRANVYGFFETSARRYRDPLRELSVFGLPREVAQDQERTSVGAHVRWLVPGRGTLPGAHSFEALAETGGERLAQEPRAGGQREDRRVRHSRMLSIGDTWDLLDGRLRLSAFERWDRSSDNYTGVDPYRPFAAQPEHVSRASGPRLGARASIGRGHTLKANYARQARFPTFTELFGCEGTLRANAELEPETGWRADAGWTWEPAARPLGMEVRAEQAFYTSRLDDMIAFVQISDHETKPFNLDRVRIDGAELACSAKHLPGLRDLDLMRAIEGRTPPAQLDASGSVRVEWQEARDEGASPVYHGKRLPYHPALQSEAEVDLVQGRWTFAYTAGYRSAVYWGRSNLAMFRTPAQWRHDLAARCAILDRRLVLGLRVENLAGRESEDVRGYPLPGRSWFGEIEWLWRPPSPETERMEQAAVEKS